MGLSVTDMIFYDIRDAASVHDRVALQATLRSRIDPVFHIRYHWNATPRLREFVRNLSREGRPVRPSLAVAAVLFTVAATFLV